MTSFLLLVEFFIIRLLPSTNGQTALIDSLPDTAFNASSSWIQDPGYLPHFSRFSSASGWGPLTDDPPNEWLLVDLGLDYVITSIGTKGSGAHNEFAKTFQLHYAASTNAFSIYPQTFVANTNRNDVVENILIPPFIARYLRFYPLESKGWPSMRVEALGYIGTLPPTKHPTQSPTNQPTQNTIQPSKFPTKSPTPAPTNNPTPAPTQNPTNPPTRPTSIPTKAPTYNPSSSPTKYPTKSPTENPSSSPTKTPTKLPTESPTTASPTKTPTKQPSKHPTTDNPSITPTIDPTKSPTPSPTKLPSSNPTNNLTFYPTYSPTINPTITPVINVDPTVSPNTKIPTVSPIINIVPTVSPIINTNPTVSPNTNIPTKWYQNLHFICHYIDDKKFISNFLSLREYADLLLKVILKTIQTTRYQSLLDFVICNVFDTDLIINNIDCPSYSYPNSEDDNNSQYIAIGVFGIVANDAINRYKREVIHIMISDDFKDKCSEFMNDEINNNTQNRRILMEYNSFKISRVEIIDPLNQTFLTTTFLTTTLDDAYDKSQNTDNSLDIIVIIIVAIAVLFVVIIVLVLILYLRKRNKNTERGTEGQFEMGNEGEQNHLPEGIKGITQIEYSFDSKDNDNDIANVINETYINEHEDDDIVKMMNETFKVMDNDVKESDIINVLNKTHGFEHEHQHENGCQV